MAQIPINIADPIKGLQQVTARLPYCVGLGYMRSSRNVERGLLHPLIDDLERLILPARFLYGSEVTVILLPVIAIFRFCAVPVHVSNEDES